MLRNLSFVFVVFSIMACSGGDKITVENAQLNALASGPLYEGINTATGTLDISAFLPQNTTVNQIQHAKVQSLKIVSKESPNIKSLTLLLTSSSISMQKIAFLDEINWKDGEIILNIAQEQEKLDEILKDKSATIVVDFDLAEDWENDWEFECKFNWEITVK